MPVEISQHHYSYLILRKSLILALLALLRFSPSNNSLWFYLKPMFIESLIMSLASPNRIKLKGNLTGKPKNKEQKEFWNLSASFSYSVFPTSPWNQAKGFSKVRSFWKSDLLKSQINFMDYLSCLSLFFLSNFSLLLLSISSHVFLSPHLQIITSMSY